jgi:hypothetical protein
MIDLLNAGAGAARTAPSRQPPAFHKVRIADSIFRNADLTCDADSADRHPFSKRKAGVADDFADDRNP